MTVTVIATLDVVADQRDTLLTELARVVPDVLAEPGCLGYLPHTVGRDKVVIVETWESTAALRAHAEAEPIRTFTEAVAPLLAAPMDVVVARPVDLGLLGTDDRNPPASR